MELPSDEAFDALITKAIDELPERYIQGLNNVAITYDDVPSVEQRRKLKLRGDESLYGLYEGVPLTKRGAGYTLVLPDKITLFKLPLYESAASAEEFFSQIKHTLWHEIAHFYGLDHDRIYEIERRWR